MSGAPKQNIGLDQQLHSNWGAFPAQKNPAYDRVQFVNVIPSISILPTMEQKLNINRKYRNGLFSKVRMGNGGLSIPLPG